jgi:hypothetical protein
MLRTWPYKPEKTGSTESFKNKNFKLNGFNPLPGFFKRHRSARLERVLKTLAFKRRYKP